MINEELYLVAVEKAVFTDNLAFNEVMERFEGKIDKYQFIDLWEKLRDERRIQKHLEKIEGELGKINSRNKLLKRLREFKENEKKEMKRYNDRLKRYDTVIMGLERKRIKLSRINGDLKNKISKERERIIMEVLELLDHSFSTILKDSVGGANEKLWAAEDKIYEIVAKHYINKTPQDTRVSIGTLVDKFKDTCRGVFFDDVRESYEYWKEAINRGKGEHGIEALIRNSIEK